MTNLTEETLRFLSQVSESEREIVLNETLKKLMPHEPSKKSQRAATSIEHHSNPQTRQRVPVKEGKTMLSSKQGSTAKIEALQVIYKEVAGCTKCELSQSRKNVVFGVGNTDTRLMFVGEAPGADEDEQGEPFVGRAGQLLNKIIIAMKMSREEVYIANILKCRPPGNRNPSDIEAHTCIPYLHRQIEIIKPELIVALGLVAALRLLKLESTTTLKSLRGRILNFTGIPMIVTYHPAALLRNPAFKAPTWEDMQMAMRFLAGEIKWEAPKTGSSDRVDNSEHNSQESIL